MMKGSGRDEMLQTSFIIDGKFITTYRGAIVIMIPHLTIAYYVAETRTFD